MSAGAAAAAMSAMDPLMVAWFRQRIERPDDSVAEQRLDEPSLQEIIADCSTTTTTATSGACTPTLLLRRAGQDRKIR